jgi:hypothetical protein
MDAITGKAPYEIDCANDITGRLALSTIFLSSGVCIRKVGGAGLEKALPALGKLPKVEQLPGGHWFWRPMTPEDVKPCSWEEEKSQYLRRHGNGMRLPKA